VEVKLGRGEGGRGRRWGPTGTKVSRWWGNPPVCEAGQPACGQAMPWERAVGGVHSWGGIDCLRGLLDRWVGRVFTTV